MRFNRTAFVFAAVMSLGFAASSFADDATGTTTTAQDSSSLTEQKNLEGHIQDEALALEAGIRELTKTTHHLKRAAWDIFVEVQRQNMVVVGEPDVIGPIVIPAIPSPTGMLPMGGFLPPSKKLLDYFMNQIEDLLKMTTAGVNGLVLPDDASDIAKDQIRTITDCLSALPQDYAALQDLTRGPNYDNVAIARASSVMQARIAEIEKSLKKLNSEAKKEVSKTKKGIRDLDKQIKKESQGK